MARKKIHRTYSKNRMKRIWKTVGIIFLLEITAVPVTAHALDTLLRNFSFISVLQSFSDNGILGCWKLAFKSEGSIIWMLFLQLILALLAFSILYKGKLSVRSKTHYLRIANDIFIPEPVEDSYVHGNARFATDKEFKKNNATQVITTNKGFDKASIILNAEILKHNRTHLSDPVEEFTISTAATHIMIIGSTRSGKTRRIYLPSIWLIGRVGDNMILNDMKGELYGYTKPYLEALGYNVLALDIANPRLSDKYPVFQPIIELLKEKETEAMAVDMVDKFVNALVPHSDKTEPIWENGEKSIIGFAVLALCKYAERETQKNLASSYHFIDKMCQPDMKGDIPLNKFVNRLKDDLGLALQSAPSRVAPEKTRGSFFTSALATLRTYANPMFATIYNTQGKSDKKIIDFEDMFDPDKKTAIFMIVPDGDSTHYSFVTLFIQMFYQYVTTQTMNFKFMHKKCHILWDEFGNFPKYNDFPQMLTIAGGKGIRIAIAVQSLGQIESVYGDDYKTIIGNMADWIYLRTGDNETNKEIVEKLGTYDARKENVNKTVNDKDDSGSYSMSADIVSRELLKMDELVAIQRPYMLVWRQEVTPNAYIAQVPELSELRANIEFGMGDEKHNQRILQIRHLERTAEEIIDVDIWVPENNTDDIIKIVNQLANIAETEKENKELMEEKKEILVKINILSSAIERNKYKLNKIEKTNPANKRLITELENRIGLTKREIEKWEGELKKISVKKSA